MQAIVHQISQQAAAMANAAATGHPGQPGAGIPRTSPSSDPSAPPHPHGPLPPGARVVITHPSFSPHIPQPVGTRGTTINLRASVPPAGGQQNLQVRREVCEERVWSLMSLCCCTLTGVANPPGELLVLQTFVPALL